MSEPLGPEDPPAQRLLYHLNMCMGLIAEVLEYPDEKLPPFASDATRQTLRAMTRTINEFIDIWLTPDDEDDQQD